MIYSLQVEKHSLAGLIKFPELFADVDKFITPSDYYNEVHNTIYSVLRDSILKNEKVDKVLLAQKIKNLGVTFKDEISIFDYVSSLTFTQITPEATFKACQELVRLRIRREIVETCDRVKSFVNTNAEKSIEEIISTCDAIYNEKIASYEIQDEPVSLFDSMEKNIEERGNNPKEENGLITPYEEFNKLFGGLRNGNIYAIVSRSGEGKTTWLNDMAFKTSLLNGNCPVLVLDTEMETVDIQDRMAAAKSGVPLWYIQTGMFRKNQDMTNKIRSLWPEVNKYKHYYHYTVGNKPIDQVCSIIRRWHLSKVGRGKPCIIIYDYLKLTGEKVGQNWAEYQALGEKVDKLKKISEEIDAPILTAMQMNRSGENFGKRAADVTDDATVISMSDRLLWFATFVAIFRKKTLDEIQWDTERFGTHKLIPLKTRFQGKEAAGHFDLLKRRNEEGEEKYVRNYLNYKVDNFSIEEVGSLRTIVEYEKQQFEINNPPKHDGNVLL
jgi:replicative DNA helicase